jgi:hypothetical protein
MIACKCSFETFLGCGLLVLEPALFGLHLLVDLGVDSRFGFRAAGASLFPCVDVVV